MRYFTEDVLSIPNWRLFSRKEAERHTEGEDLVLRIRRTSCPGLRRGELQSHEGLVEILGPLIVGTYRPSERLGRFSC